jgi:hypothetical protein
MSVLEAFSELAQERRAIRSAMPGLSQPLAPSRRQSALTAGQNIHGNQIIMAKSYALE